MGFINDRLLTNYSYGSSGGPGFRTGVLALRSGATQRLQRQAAARRMFDAGYSIRTVQDAYDVLEFFISIGGAANSFRWKDWIDYASTADGTTIHGNIVANSDVEIGVGDGSQTEFQLIKTYSNAIATVSRTIQLPVSGTVLVAVDAVSQTEGVDFTVNLTTGVVLFATAPPDTDSITAGFEFDVPVAFTPDADILLAATIDSFDSNSVPTITLEEELNMIAQPELVTNGGSRDFGGTTIVLSLSIADGRAIRVAPTVAHNVNFPDVSPIEPGGPIFAIFNEGSQTLTLRYSDTITTIGTVPASTAAEVWLVENATSGLKEWQLK